MTSPMQVVALGCVFLAYGGFAVLSVILTVVDVRTHRLPHRLVLPAYPAAWVLLGASAVLRGDGEAALRAVIGMLALFTGFAALRMLQPGGLGGGDVTLAGLIGWMLGFLGWDPLLVAVVAGVLTGGVFSLGMLVVRRARRSTAIAFGPWLLLGAWIGVASHMFSG